MPEDTVAQVDKMRLGIRVKGCLNLVTVVQSGKRRLGIRVSAFLKLNILFMSHLRSVFV